MKIGNRAYIGVWTGIGLTFSSMVGTGVFTSLGYQISDHSSLWSIVLLWVIGGFTAFTGGICYYQLIKQYPDSGGEVHFINELYGSKLSIVVALLSIVFGFAAPVALAALAVASYIQLYVPFAATQIALVTIIAVSGIHLLSLQISSIAQRILFLLKIGLIVVFICAAIPHMDVSTTAWQMSESHLQHLLSGKFFIALMFVHYSYSGWNTCIYVFREMRNRRTFFLSLFISVILVTVLYVLLNVSFISVSGLANLRGVTEVGQRAAYDLFGAQVGAIFSTLIGILLIANISAMIWSGSRVSLKTEEILCKRSNNKPIPSKHILLLMLVSLLFVLVSNFESLLITTSFILSLSMILVIGSLAFHSNKSIFKLRITTRLCAVFFCIITLVSNFYYLYNEFS
ncbi:amino acid permease [Sphingobacterium oryzagri]|uniref:Amino acid permease n=1 Tax=Sphingobacterium oryzagri TaxID=3025669 RepID=A0ABY7WFQ0_9SPHI|nr:amino acid permease [Sphingobacterium sp. KACC 22765]WDF67105.1 amino acid permease [Sphingobacterium sp. KACC 22765]